MINLYEELGETSRRAILSELRSGARNVTELVTATGLKQPNVSNHLARMRSKGIVKASKIGRQVFYSLASPEIEAIVNSVFASRPEPSTNVDLEDLAKQYAKAAIQGDEHGCNELMDVVFRARVPMIEIYQDMLTPAMALVGTWYKVEAIDEAQEHLATAITERMMARTVQLNVAPRKTGYTAILGCAAGSRHTIGLRMISDYLRFSGWKTLFLGADVPHAAFTTAVRQHRPSLVLLSVSASESVDATLELIRELNDSSLKRSSYCIGVGGGFAIAEAYRMKEAGSDFVATDLRHFAERILPAVELNGRPSEEDSLPRGYPAECAPQPTA